MPQTAPERRREIGQIVRKAMAQLPDVEWSKESEAISQTQAGLDEVMTLYVEGNASKLQVKTAYKAWVNAFREDKGN